MFLFVFDLSVIDQSMWNCCDWSNDLQCWLLGCIVKVERRPKQRSNDGVTVWSCYKKWGGLLL